MSLCHPVPHCEADIALTLSPLVTQAREVWLQASPRRRSDDSCSSAYTWWAKLARSYKNGMTVHLMVFFYVFSQRHFLPSRRSTTHVSGVSWAKCHTSWAASFSSCLPPAFAPLPPPCCPSSARVRARLPRLWSATNSHGYGFLMNNESSSDKVVQANSVMVPSPLLVPGMQFDCASRRPNRHCPSSSYATRSCACRKKSLTWH